MKMTKKIDLFREGLKHNKDVDLVAFAHEFDFSNTELLQLSGMCPKCKGPLDIDEYGIYCPECGWTLS